MAKSVNAVDENSERIEGTQIAREAVSKYIRYTEKQVEVLEMLYDVCPAPTCFQREQILRDQPILRGIEAKHLKVWFQNRRCREKQKKETDGLLEDNRNLAAANNHLLAENASLYNKVARLIFDNELLQNQLLSLISTTASIAATKDQGFDAETRAPELSMTVADNKCPLENCNPATLSSEANPVVANSLNQSISAAVSYAETNLSKCFANAQEETYAGINSLEGNPVIELLMYPDPFRASLHVNQPNASMGPTNLVEANQHGSLSMTQEPVFRATNFTEEYPAGELLFVPGPNFVATPVMGTTVTPAAAYSVRLANLMCQSYRSIFGADMIGVNGQDNNSLFELVQDHQYAILCFSFASLPVCFYANLSGLRMLETTIDYAPSLSLDKILLETSDISLSTVMQQGYAILSHGLCKTEMNHKVMYEKCVLWKVNGPDGSLNCIALAFINWFFV